MGFNWFDESRLGGNLVVKVTGGCWYENMTLFFVLRYPL